MKAPHVLAIIAVLVLLLTFTNFDLLSTTSAPTLIPVEFEEQDNPDGYTGMYWVGTAQITGTDTKYKLVPEGGSYSDSITVDITGIETAWTAPLSTPALPLEYGTMKTKWFVPYSSSEPVPYKNVGTSARFEAKATVKIDSPNEGVKTYSLTNTGSDSTIPVSIKDKDGISRTAYFKFNGVQLASGNLPPTGDLVLLDTDVYGGHRLVKTDFLNSAVSNWNTCVFPYCGESKSVCNLDWTTCTFVEGTYPDTWDETYTYMSVNNQIPDEGKPPTSIGLTASSTRVNIAYPTSTFAPIVTFYIPEALAEYVVLVEQEPSFAFDSISTLEGVECESARLTVTGTATGSGTIMLYLDSTAVKSVSWDGGAEKQIVKGADYTFRADVNFACGIDADKNFDATVRSDAGGLGADTSRMFKIYLADKDTADIFTLSVKAVQEGTNTIIDTAPIYIGATSVASGEASKNLPAGTYTVYSEDVEGWYTPNDKDHPLTVSLTADKTVTLEFTTEPPTEWPMWLTVVVIFAGIIGVGLIILILRELGIEITGNQITVLVIVVVIAIVAYYMIDAVNRLTDVFGGA